MASITTLNRNKISPIAMTAHCDEEISSTVESEQAKWNTAANPNERQKGERRKNTGDIEMESEKKGRAISREDGGGARYGLGMEYRISRWRRISLAPADTMQICVRYLPTPKSGPPRFPDAPIPTVQFLAGRCADDVPL